MSTDPWPGIIEAYRDRLPVDAATPVVTLLEGGTPLVPAPRLSEQVRGGVPEGRRGQPDRFVQGPGHDARDHEGARERRQGGRVRVDGQHVGVGRRVLGAPASSPRCSSPMVTLRSASSRRR